MSFSIGDEAPALELPGTDGALHSLPERGTATATVVVWTCNHCPYALAWHDRIQAVAREWSERGARFLQVNPNDATRYPADSPDAMARRVARDEFATPYLHDASQSVARAWGALKTPDVYVCDGELRLAYRGAPDADYDDPSLDAAWLRGALEAVIEGRPPDPAETAPVGCGVKWANG